MDPSNDEQTVLLRDIWKQLVATDRNLTNRIDQTNARLVATDHNLTNRIDQTNARVDQTNATLTAFIEQTQGNFETVQRNFETIQRNFDAVQRRFERIDERFDRLEERDRARDVEARLMRLELHVGLRDARRSVAHDEERHRVVAVGDLVAHFQRGGIDGTRRKAKRLFRLEQVVRVGGVQAGAKQSEQQGD